MRDSISASTSEVPSAFVLASAYAKGAAVRKHKEGIFGLIKQNERERAIFGDWHESWTKYLPKPFSPVAPANRDRTYLRPDSIKRQHPETTLGNHSSVGRDCNGVRF